MRSLDTWLRVLITGTLLTILSLIIFGIGIKIFDSIFLQIAGGSGIVLGIVTLFGTVFIDDN